MEKEERVEKVDRVSRGYKGAPGKGGKAHGAKGFGGKKGDGGKGGFVGKGVPQGEFQGFCSYCTLWGHSQRYCPKKAAEWNSWGGAKGGAHALEGTEDTVGDQVG